jgi:uncharacterized protein YfbU (UPF0304 family)
MKLSDGETLSILMLCDLLSGKKDGIDPEFIRQAIVTKNTWGIRWQYPGLFDESEPNPPMVTEVVNYLDMWHLIETAYAKLTVAQKADVDKAISNKVTTFSGFDHNNEFEYASIAGFLAEHLERFPYFKNRVNINSHSPRVGLYRRMYARFERIRPELAERELSADELIAILNGRAWI